MNMKFNESAVYEAALALAKFAKLQGKPVAVSIESYAHFIVGNVQRNPSKELQDWLKPENDNQELTAGIASEIVSSRDHQKASADVVARFVEVFRDSLTCEDIHAIGDFAFVEYGQCSEQYEGILDGTVYLLMPFPKAADCAVLEM